MRLKDNLILYIFIGVTVYLLSSLELREVPILLKYIMISVFIGVTVESISYKIAVNLNLTMFGTIIFSFIMLTVVIIILLITGIVKDIIFTSVISIVITIFMDIVTYRRYLRINQKLDEAKNNLDGDDE